jgi:hypothetical protein
MLVVTRTAVGQLAALTGRRPDGVSGVRRTEDGWRLSIDVVELERVPATTSMLATFEVETDSDGNLVSYERVRRFPRNASELDGDSG